MCAQPCEKGETPDEGEAEFTRPGLTDTVAAQLIARSPFSMVLSDPSLPDVPIIYANGAFFDATGYSPSEVIGRNCRFLQGPGTDPSTVARIRAALEESREITADILNYTAEGQAFWNRLLIAPIEDPLTGAKYFLGVQKPLGMDRLIDGQTREALLEAQHRVKNHLAMIVGLIRMEGRNVPNDQPFQMLARRVEALRLLYDELTYREGENSGAIELGVYLRRIAGTIAVLGPKGGIEVGLTGESLTVPADVAVQCGLIVSELCANSMRHAFGSDGTGRIGLHLERAADGGLLLEVMDRPTAPLIPAAEETGAPEAGGGLGVRIIEQLTRQLGGTIAYHRGPEGMTVTMTISPKALT